MNKLLYSAKIDCPVCNSSFEVVKVKCSLLSINQKVIDVPKSDMSPTMIRISWLYRLNNDEESEFNYLTAAAKYYAEAYNQQEFPIGKLDESTCLYIIGECYRRAKKFEDALKWFGLNVTLPATRKNFKISEMLLDQMEEIKRQIKYKRKTTEQLTN